MILRKQSEVKGTKRSVETAQRDIVTLGIAVAALILFVGTTGTVMPQIVRSWMGAGAAPDVLLTNAVLLNIALLIFGWRRYDDLHHEVQERRKAENLARELAEIDPLTGALNRRSGPKAVNALLSVARENGEEVAILLIDLDNFKQINDCNGHHAGDGVLETISKRILVCLPEDGLLIRLGGDEFACALTFAPGQRDRIDTLAEELTRSVSKPIEIDDLTLETTISIGMVASDSHESDDAADQLIHQADIAMYHAKKRGKNRFFWFERRMETELRHRNELEKGIREGIKAAEFVPFYEQQVDLNTGEIVGFEMLARWQSPQFGLVTPENFIPLAEELDLIGCLSEQLLKQAFIDAGEWHPRLSLSVNISPVQLRDPWFAQKLLRLLAESNFPAKRLEIEITESCIHENIGAVRSIIVSLKNQGIRVSLDDFGTGYSSLSQLRTLPFDRMKIDRSFVAEIADEENCVELVRAIVSLGKGLSLPITAEGVENANALAVLKEMGDFDGQGYLYGQPENARKTRARLAELGLLAPGLQAQEPQQAEEAVEKRLAG